jgi:hypothetical protein
MSMKNVSDNIGNRNRDLQTCSALHQSSALPCAPCKCYRTIIVYRTVFMKMNLRFETCRRHKKINPFRSYIGPRSTVWFSSFVPMSEDVRHGFCCVCSPAVGACRRFSSCSTDFSQQIAQIVLFLFLHAFLFKNCKVITSNPPTSLPPKTNKSWGVCGWQKNCIRKG